MKVLVFGAGVLGSLYSERLLKIADTLKKAKLDVTFSANIDSWKCYYVALAIPFGRAMYMNESCNIRLSKNREDVVKCLQGIREAFAVLRKLGYPVETPKLRWIFALPNFILAPLFQLVLKSKNSRHWHGPPSQEYQG